MRKAKFNYPEVFIMLPDYTEHAGQVVEVLRPCTEKEADGPNVGCEQMFLVRASDGWEGMAFENELEDIDHAD